MEITESSSYDSEEAKVLKERSAGLFQCKGRQAMEGTGGI